MKKLKLREKINNFGFQMAFFYLAAGLAVIALFSGVVYTVVSDIFVKEAVSKTQMAIETSADSIGDYISNYQRLLAFYSNNPSFLEFSDGTEKSETQILHQLIAIKESDSHVFEVFVVLLNGKTIATRKLPNKVDLQQLKADFPCLSNERIDAYGHFEPWTVTISQPIQTQSGEKLGVIVMDLDYCLFSQKLSKIDMGKNGNIAIMSANDELIFHTNQLESNNNDVDNQNKLVFQAGYIKNENLLTHSLAIPGTNWTMIGKASLDGLIILKRQISDLVVFTGILLFFALLVITVIFSRKLTTPISRLVKSMEDIENLAELSIKLNEINEIVVLTDSYNRMIHKIKWLMQALEKNHVELRQLEMDALTNQINPHFLYNTLDTIVWLAEFRDNDKIIALTKSLAAFFRLSLNGGRAVVSLQDELKQVKQYLFIQKERYGDKLTYAFDIDDDTLDFIVPKIILQPIVENSLYHGIKPMDGTGQIKIKVSKKNETLIICISDNGVGFDMDDNSLKSNQKNGGVGLINVKKRVKIYYSQQADVMVVSQLGKGTTVTLSLS